MELLNRLNPFLECSRLRWRLFECPPFLFLLMGVIIIVSMLATHSTAVRFTDEPEIAALLVILVTAFLLIIGHFLIAGFNKIAEASRMKSEFLSIITHQLRSPLAVLKWTLNAVDLEKSRIAAAHPEEPLRWSENTQNLFRTLNKTTEEMVRLVNLLLDITRIEARSIILERKPFHIETLTEEIVRSYGELVRASNLALTFEHSNGLPATLGDQERVRMVIENLVDNAIRYTPGGKTVSIRIIRETERVRWEITDQGIGIPKNVYGRIFTKFFRAENAKILQTHGTGTGLYAARFLIEKLNGKIGFHSQEGMGSMFWFTLPVEKTINSVKISP